MEISKWIIGLSKMEGWSEPGSVETFELMSSDDGGQAKTLLLQAERTVNGSKHEALVTFSLELLAPSTDENVVLWVSNLCRFSEVDRVEKTLASLLVQLLEEIINRAPNNSISPLFKLGAETSDTLLSYPSESICHFLDFIFTCRFFWICLCNAPSEIGSRFFEKFSSALVSSPSKRVLEGFLMSLGGDLELKIVRSLGYLYTKLLILRNFDEKIKELDLKSYLSSYANASHDFLVFKGYVPLLAMNQECTNESQQGLSLDTTESVLKYTLAHQQLETVVQFEYSVNPCKNYAKVDFKIDNVRINVNQLRFDGSEVMCGEKHFPSRVSISLGPKPGSSYVTGLSLGRSTPNHEKEVEIQKTIKGYFGKSKTPSVKAITRTATSTRMKSWTVDQDAEGDTATFDIVLSDNSSGVEVATWRPSANSVTEVRNSFRGRYSSAGRSFGSRGGLVIAGDEYGERVSWRLKKEAQGRELKWKVGCKVWLTYLPNELKSSYMETRCVQWDEEFTFFF